MFFINVIFVSLISVTLKYEHNGNHAIVKNVMVVSLTEVISKITNSQTIYLL